MSFVVRARIGPLPLAQVWVVGPNRRVILRILADEWDVLDDVRERAAERLRFDVFAQWSDPREVLGLRRTA